MLHIGANGGTIPSPTNHNCNITGDIYFNSPTNNYTGNLFYIHMGKLKFSGRIHGTKNYAGFGLAGSIFRFGQNLSSIVLSDAYIHSDLDSSLVSYTTSVLDLSTLIITNSYIEMTSDVFVLADLTNTNTFIQNTTIKNKGTNYILYNPSSASLLQITNSTLINLSDTLTTIYYPTSTISSAGSYSNKVIDVLAENGTVTVVANLI